MKAKTSKTRALICKLALTGLPVIAAGVILVTSIGLPSIIVHGAGHELDVTPSVLPLQSHAFGKTYGEWAAEWLRFALPIPLDQNPRFNPQAVAIGQSGHVSFMAGPIRGGEANVTIPAGNALFFPTLFSTSGTCPEFNEPLAPGQTLEEFLAESVSQSATFLLDAVTEWTLEVDGVLVKNPSQYRASSGVLSFDLDPSLAVVVAPCGTGAGAHIDMVDGCWLMLAPLSKGQHTVHETVTLGPPINFSGEVTSHITVK